jgi:predicted DsbA family dithiol-disulfide isomerase
MLVEYLNAYCPHCRKTLKRLEQVLDETGAPVRKRRVYTWASNDYPLWARACAYAQTLGREEAMFRELMQSRGQSRREVFAAARRAGLPMDAFKTAVSKAAPPKRLVRDRALVQRARIRMLPTIDIGRRRLQGEQSASELREALRVAQRQHVAQAH